VEQIALGAVKFTDFAQDKKTSMLFDWDRIFNVQGFSGPYIQYAAVRVRSILRKFGQGQQTDVTDYDWEAEQSILFHLARYPSVIREAAQYYEPHRVALYLYELARLLNQYYENTQVGNAKIEKVRELRLGLLGAVGNVFDHGLGILGIEVPEKM
jgi:arginyl-tRNA synthetase